MTSTTSHPPTEQASLESDQNLSADELLVGRHSDTTPQLSVVMPTLNEEAGIRTCIEWIKTAVEELQVLTEIIISDSSTDRTPEIAREMGAIVVEPDGEGYGYAYRYAFERTRGTYIAMGDADTTYDFKQIPRLLDHLEETGGDMVMGSRLDGEIEDGAMPSLHQYIGNPALTRFLNTFYRAGVSDAHSGFRIFTREAYETMDWETTGMEFASEMIMDAGSKDLEIVEVPIVYHEREGEETLDSFRDGWRHVRFMLVNAPGYLFSVPGLLLTLFGVAVMTISHTGVALGEITLGVNSMIAGSLAAIVGTQVGSLAVFATVASDPIQRPEDPITSGITRYATLERGATAGVLVFAAGGAYASWLIGDWILSGFGSVPFTSAALIAFTAVVVGIQLVFSSFFLSTVN
ncbi:glycosyltransferase [Halorubrum ezzemoulense]|uniref:DPM/DPG synthase family glycosyltransferase n=1 Tax=Halorubrum ezzemoulense TaxID=337243 RepID=UPI0023313790|nr:DPM/DPG synthase family glycosyltransferase [Halorubrum ezzemoulense]MDB9250832.1 glycosyltransferase [Halorubrum ezzemoulense]MDB9261003.1 glycosyltransferase [Halorubrum ezzemoulense]MDB9263941.1 glycosyltransferase [Halorubrum ezzemoulense]MDB9267215.1 glycosyltransferase [Halorubrum ezzemoulense]MDB9271364.1 glycosyltransferase [Halorubrum ezzemoulense]